MERGQSYGVSLRNVTKAFGENVVLDGVDLEMAPGSLTTLLGPSGCGKTTILRLIAGLEFVTSGRIFIGEEDVTNLSASRRDVAMVFQSYALFPHMTMGENVGYGLKVQGVPAEERRARVADALAAVGLEGFEGRYINQLSGGQQQRIAVARALILEPQVMLFDEPLSNLDTKLRRQMREDIRRLQQETGITSVYVTHDQSEALSVSDSVVVMNEGGIAQMGPPEELYLRPASAFVATFMGDASILPATVVKKGEKASVEIAGVSIPLTREAGAQADAGAAQVAIRPEAVTLEKKAGGGLRGEVISRAYIGSATEYMVRTERGEVFSVMPAQAPRFAIGETVGLRINPVGVAVIHA